uniref:Uncharacterized protein n=1 Tax=Anguilla anguilla TaxID=7936 RepID=A0A0E9W9J6_ANGAN
MFWILAMEVLRCDFCKNHIKKATNLAEVAGHLLQSGLISVIRR